MDYRDKLGLALDDDIPFEYMFGEQVFQDASWQPRTDEKVIEKLGSGMSCRIRPITSTPEDDSDIISNIGTEWGDGRGDWHYKGKEYFLSPAGNNGFEFQVSTGNTYGMVYGSSDPADVLSNAKRIMAKL